eukprot:scaffold633_cov288-Ochromonas_danica.AAC.4
MAVYDIDRGRRNLLLATGMMMWRLWQFSSEVERRGGICMGCLAGRGRNNNNNRTSRTSPSSNENTNIRKRGLGNYSGPIGELLNSLTTNN